MNLSNMITSQFQHPRGFFGSIAGMIMAWENRERNTWVIELLDVQPADSILEIGFGPGWAIQQAARLATEGLVAGADVSRTMVQQAGQRNAAAIRAGHVELKQGAAAALPYGDAAFDKVFAVNSIQIWPEPLAGLKEIRRVLKPGGRVVITLQPVWDKTPAFAQKVGGELVAQLNQAGFNQVRLETRQLQSGITVSGIGVK